MNIYRIKNREGFAEIIAAMNVELAIAKFHEEWKDDNIKSVELIFEGVKIAGAHRPVQNR